MAKVTITTDDGELVSQWTDKDDELPEFSGVGWRQAQFFDDFRIDLDCARRMDRRDPSTGDGR